MFLFHHWMFDLGRTAGIHPSINQMETGDGGGSCSDLQLHPSLHRQFLDTWNPPLTGNSIHITYLPTLPNPDRNKPKLSVPQYQARDSQFTSLSFH